MLLNKYMAILLFFLYRQDGSLTFSKELVSVVISL